MEQPPIVSREEWLAARLDLLAREKEITRARDEVNAARRALPRVEITKDYTFTGPAGPVALGDLFEGRRQLIVYHFMWRFDLGQGCPTCSFVIDSVGDLAHLHACDTTLALVSRAPIEDIEPFRQRMGWSMPWYSSYGGDFNYDFHVTADDSRGQVEYNYKDKPTLEREGIGFWVVNGQDGAGASVFLRDGERIFHTYSTFGRGTDLLIGTYNYLDLTPLGRQRMAYEFPYHDQYGEPVGAHHEHG